jgi:hypothetical protein
MKESRSGVQARMTSTPALTSLLSIDAASGKPAIVQGFPSDILAGPDASYFPRITWLTPVDEPINRPVAEFTFQIDEWVWPTGATGGYGRLEAIDEQILALFDDKVWIQSGKRLHSRVDQGRDYPGTKDLPHRRMRMLNVIIS